MTSCSPYLEIKLVHYKWFPVNQRLLMRGTNLFLLLLFDLLITLNSFSQGTPVARNQHTLQPGVGLLPVPQTVSLSSQRHSIDDSWTIVPAADLSKNDPALNNLISESKERFGLRLKTGKANTRS